MGNSPLLVERDVEIVNVQGLHARPVMRIYDMASQFQCAIHIRKGEIVADARSAMEMMLLEAPKGTILKLCAEGVDAQAAVDAIAKLIADKFYEDPPP